MVNRILSLQLVFTLAASQAWALVGGPYDGQLSLAAMSGTYGISLAGTSANSVATDAAGLNGTTGVMLLSVPQRGLSVAKTLIFDQGLMYFGSSTGVVKASNRGGTATMVTQLVHYVVRTNTDGDSSNTGTYPTETLNGAMKLRINPDYFTGITTVSGSGSFWKTDLLLTSIVNTTSTTTDTDGVPVTTTTVTNVVPGQDISGTTNGNGGLNVPESNRSDAPISTNQAPPSLTVSADGVFQSASVTGISNFVLPSAATFWGVGAGETGVAGAAGNAN
jgi:hypothetical protein